MQEAMTQVKNDLGRDAVILHTRRFHKGGFWGFFTKEVIEVMAALENQAAAVVENKPLPVVVPSMKVEDTKEAAMQLELVTMRNMLEQLLRKVPQSDKLVSPLLELLVKNDIDVQIAENLIKGLPGEKSIIGNDPLIVRQLLLDRISNYLQRIEGISIPKTICKNVAFIGPTGVGKTTTIAKLAANFALKEGYKVALVTADTYRISAVEQLRTYADIIGVPIEVVYTAGELKDVLSRHQDKHLVLIDTAGRSPHNEYQMAELQALFEVDFPIEKHLVLSATTKYKDALAIVNKFAVCSPEKLVFTKMDEASTIGTILNLLYQFPATLSYVTTGQSVPDDIELANHHKLASLILRD
jgi:flagellar biosynthesis protein FlhF